MNTAAANSSRFRRRFAAAESSLRFGLLSGRKPNYTTHPSKNSIDAKMRRFVDLHTHSTASDGSVSPEELLALAERKRLAAVALTDHDTIDGLAAARAAAGRYPNLRFVAGVEVSAQPPSGTLHILGLGIDESTGPLARLLEYLRGARTRRNPKIVALCRKLGLKISRDDVLAAAAACGSPQEVISRVHIAAALLRNGCVRSEQEAFDKYLARGKGAYVERERMTPSDTIAAIRSAGGLAVLSHPVQLKYGNLAQLERIVRGLVDHGLEGIEAYHSDHTDRQVRQYLDLAKRFGLAVTGGSDFHGPVKPQVRLGIPRVPISMIEERFAERLFGSQ